MGRCQPRKIKAKGVRNLPFDAALENESDRLHLPWLTRQMVRFELISSETMRGLGNPNCSGRRAACEGLIMQPTRLPLQKIAF